MSNTLRFLGILVCLFALLGCDANSRSISMRAHGRTITANVNGVAVQVADGNADVQVDNSVLRVNGKRYGSVKTGDVVEVSSSGVFINGEQQ